MAGGGKLDVVSEGGMILAGASVKVVEADGVRIVVRQID
jgi:membrane-bound ClpP family serine protease